MKILVSGPVAVVDEQGRPVTRVGELKKLAGAVYDDDVCSNYFSDELDEAGVVGGILRLTFDAKRKQLRVVAEFRAPRKLSKKLLQLLVEETQAQWSDGLGEGPCFEEIEQAQGVQIDLAPIDAASADVDVEQIKDGVKVAANKSTALTRAAESGDIDKVRKLLAKGESVDAVDKYGMNLLQNAIHGGHTELTLLLLRMGADFRKFPKDNNWNAFHTAAVRGNSDAIAAMLAQGMDVDYRCREKTTPLMWAANRGHHEVARQLIKAGADVNAQDDTDKINGGRTPLMYAAPDDMKMIKLLIKHGADPSIRNYMKMDMIESCRDQARAFREFGDDDEAKDYEKLVKWLEKQVG